jgi:hypothetical protein
MLRLQECSPDRDGCVLTSTLLTSHESPVVGHRLGTEYRLLEADTHNVTIVIRIHNEDS